MPLDWDVLIVLLRRKFACKDFALTKHANQRCGERDVAIRGIENCIMSGEIIEEQTHGPDPKVLILGDKEDGTSFYIVVAITEDKPVVITVCGIDENVWEIVAGIIRRR